MEKGQAPWGKASPSKQRYTMRSTNKQLTRHATGARSGDGLAPDVVLYRTEV